MRRLAGALVLACACIAITTVAVGSAGLPLWAYGYNVLPAADAPIMSCTAARPAACARGGIAKDDGALLSLPAGQGAFTLTQIHANFGPVDWYPGDHPPMPPIVARGREADGIRACALCHYPNGQGRPENAPVGGLTVGYFLQQMSDFKNGLRKSSDPRKANNTEMVAMAQALTDAEVRVAAEYFSKVAYRPWIKVVESNTVPKFSAGINGLFTQMNGQETEPIGQRLIEMPASRDGTLLTRDHRSGFIAYVPVGTLAKGEVLVTTGGATVAGGQVVPGRTLACATCHGPELKGVADIPPIAGRPASYIARQLYDMQQGHRNGAMTALMTPVVTNLTEDDLLAISAYVASRAP